MAIRFNLAEHVHTDIVSHSTDGFPTHDGYRVPRLPQGRGRKRPRSAFAEADRAVPGITSGGAGFCADAEIVSIELCAGDSYFGVTAFAFTNKFRRNAVWALPHCPGGRKRAILSDDEVTKLAPNYHFEEIVQRIATGLGPVHDLGYRLQRRAIGPTMRPSTGRRPRTGRAWRPRTDGDGTGHPCGTEAHHLRARSRAWRALRPSAGSSAGTACGDLLAERQAATAGSRQPPQPETSLQMALAFGWTYARALRPVTASTKKPVPKVFGTGNRDVLPCMGSDRTGIQIYHGIRNVRSAN